MQQVGVKQVCLISLELTAPIICASSKEQTSSVEEFVYYIKGATDKFTVYSTK